jgi:hypothetical protein
MPRQTAVIATVRWRIARGQAALTLVDLPGRGGSAATHDPIEHRTDRESTGDPGCSSSVYLSANAQLGQPSIAGSAPLAPAQCDGGVRLWGGLSHPRSIDVF